MNKELTRIERISAILVQLQSRPIVTSMDMAQRFGVSTRTIYRDIQTLCEVGIPICSTAGEGYSLIEGYKLPSLLFTKEEAIAFLTAEKIIGQITDSKNSIYFQQGMDKIRAALKLVDKQYLSDMDDSISIYKSRQIKESLPNAMQLILGSISDKLSIHIQYVDMDDNETSRILEAVGITYSYPNWYLMAWCLLRKDYRMFRLDRISDIRLLPDKQTKTHPPLNDLLGCDEPQKLTEVVLQTSSEISKSYADRCYFMGLVEEKQLDNHRVEQTFNAYSLDSIARWVLANADSTIVIKPKEVKEIIKKIINKLDL